MPYRVKKGEEVLLVLQDDSTNIVKLKRTTDFTKKELHCSPMDEHWKEGFPISEFRNYPWGFDVEAKWETGDKADSVVLLYAEDVHTIDKTVPKSQSTMLVEGSGTNQYTVTMDEKGHPIKCSCPAYRFRNSKKGKGGPCKHMQSLLD